MANDVSNKSTSVSGTGNVANQTENNNASDQQKIPPLRISLSTSGNQKSWESTNHTTTKKEKVRIKLGTNKKAKTTNDDEESSSSSNISHLRRITRRSHRANNTNSNLSINNEDEESISSMTSIDENFQNTNSDQISLESDLISSAATTSAQNISTSAQNGSNSNNNNSNNSAETPRRYKRRKGEPSESQSLDGDLLLGIQNYKLPDQNSIELYKNIRNQVDKRLRNLNIIQPQAPHGFRDYMLSRGAYLLDGNKLGNGTNLFMNEDGGLNPPPMGKYHLIRQSRINYSVPSHAKVPLGLPVNSPLYELFIEQEKERHRMRMQHIKEREKLTLATEQEIVRVYNQASLSALNQSEPFSACTMLKHQEIYDYLNSEGKIILSRENAHQDQTKPDGVRTRRRQHGHISPGPTTTNSTSQCRKNSNTDEAQAVAASLQHDDKLNPSATRSNSSNDQPTNKPIENSSDGAEKVSDESKITLTSYQEEMDSTPAGKQATSDKHSDTKSDDTIKQREETEKQVDSKIRNVEETVEENMEPHSSPSVEQGNTDPSKNEGKPSSLGEEENIGTESQDLKKITIGIKEEPMEVEEAIDTSTIEKQTESIEETKNLTINDDSMAAVSGIVDGVEASEEQNSEESQHGSSSTCYSNQQRQHDDNSSSMLDEDKLAYNKEQFLNQLQEVDDKWEQIRKEMLVRHKNEAESLHAIQKLEWEWKTKEIGACDVRATPVIDNTLVPKLTIYPQDY